MITKEEMINPILVVSPDFSPTWHNLLSEHEKSDDLPIYVALTELARHISHLHLNNRIDEVKAVFAVIEDWHLEGDTFVHEAVTSGLLEDLQNMKLNAGGEKY